MPFGRWLDQVIEEAAGDAAALGCLDEVLCCRAIVADGTSADAATRQVLIALLLADHSI